MQQLTYTRCGLADLETLTTIARDTFFETFASQNKPENINTYVEKAFSRSSVEKELLDQGSEFYFALDAGKWIGYLKINNPGSHDG